MILWNSHSPDNCPIFAQSQNLFHMHQSSMVPHYCTRLEKNWSKYIGEIVSQSINNNRINLLVRIDEFLGFFLLNLLFVRIYSAISCTLYKFPNYITITFFSLMLFCCMIFIICWNSLVNLVWIRRTAVAIILV